MQYTRNRIIKGVSHTLERTVNWFSLKTGEFFSKYGDKRIEETEEQEENDLRHWKRNTFSDQDPRKEPWPSLDCGELCVRMRKSCSSGQQSLAASWWSYQHRSQPTAGEDSEVKHTNCSFRETEFDSQHSHRGSQWSAAPVLEDLTYSSDLSQHPACMCHIVEYTDKTFRDFFKKKNMFLKIIHSQIDPEL